ncbi:MAG: hypothetical protein ABW277_04905 [Longimicrobiaceae bacterium]
MLELDGETLSFDVSYLPHDFIAELVAALTGVLGGPGEYVARICEEPTEHDWRFRSFDPSAVAFEVVTYPDGRGGRGEVVARTWGTPLDVVLPFWQGLRDLSDRAAAERFRANWSAPFPFDALDRLSERVEQAG